VVEIVHQRTRDGQVADASIRIDVSRGATLNALNYFQTACFANRKRASEQIEFMPGRPASG